MLFIININNFDKYKMSHICRVCLSEGELVSIFSTENSLQISSKIMSCCSVRIYEGDNLPSNICPSCKDRLDNSYQFKLQCEDSDSKLRQRLNNLEEDSYYNDTDETDVKSETEFTNIMVKSERDYADHRVKSEESFLEYNLPLKCMLNSADGCDVKNENGPCNGLEISQNEKSLKRIDEDILPKLRKRGRKKINNSSFLIEKNVEADSEEIVKKVRKVRGKKAKLPLNTEENTLVSEIARKRVPNKNKVSVKRDKESGNKTNQCYTCGKIVSSRFRLKMHMRTHTGEKPFICTYCNKTFALSQNLKVHERVHTGEKPLLCGICGKTFAQSAGLVAHMRLHTGETPYKCDLCPASFRTPGHLQYHIRQHTGEKNFECEVCNRAFITKGDLTQHHRTHTGERPFVCTVCGLRMSRSSHLTRHMLTHTGEKPHRCTICGSAYAQKGDLVRHIKRHAGESNHRIAVNAGTTSNTPRGAPSEGGPQMGMDTRLGATGVHLPTQGMEHSNRLENGILDTRLLTDNRNAIDIRGGLGLDPRGSALDSRGGLLHNRGPQINEIDPRTLGLGLGLGLLHSHHVQ